MLWKKVALASLPAVWTFLPLFAVEQTADYFYFAHNPEVFFTVSGLRLTLFIVIVVLGSVSAGRMLGELRSSVLAELVGISLALLSFYVLCDSRVCFSTGIDGLEPLRMGFFLASIAVSGAALGASARGVDFPRAELLTVGFFGFAAVTYLPVVYTFAGTKILWGLQPWAVAAVLALPGFSVAASLGASVGSGWGFATPVAALGAVMGISSGIAASYLTSLLSVALLMVLATAAASALGAIAAGQGRRGLSGRRSVSGAYLLGLLLVLLLLVFTVPDAVNGVVPSLPGTPSALVFGAPVYVGGYMDAPPGHALGAEVTVSFSSTNYSAIQGDNFLAAGLGIHGAGCCVDGIDYSYRFDVYLFHGGSETLAASGWEVCDSNAACGGHSWKRLMFEADHPLAVPDPGQPISLRIQWDGGDLVWSYARGGGEFHSFTRFTVPSPENHNFNTGVLEGGGANLQESGVYFFQFGAMSRYPIGHGGWRVGLLCPSILTTGWGCVEHARTLSGSQSFWKVIWRWGEDYPGVSVSAFGNRTMILENAPNSAPDFQTLW